MRGYKKFAFVLVLLSGLAVYSFGESYLGLTGGYYRLNDGFPKENYGRSINGGGGLFSFHYFPGESPLGFNFNVFSGGLSSGMEWKDELDLDSMGSIKSGVTIWDLRFSLGAAYKFKLGESVRLPLSLGPVLSLYTEEYYDYDYSDNGDYQDKSTYYDAFNLGLMLDASVIINPFPRFRILFFKAGILLDWDFLRVERGEMSMNYRQFKSARYKNTPYMSFGLSPYLGIGLLLP